MHQLFLMRYVILLALLCNVFGINKLSAQTQNLISLAQGEFLGMNALFQENGDLFGYISLYGYGKTSEKTKKFEYVILDKNLNPFANNTFEGDITAGNYRGYMTFDGTITLRPTELDLSQTKKKEHYTPFSMVIDLKENTVKKKIFYDFDHGEFKDVTEHNSWAENKKEYKLEKKEKGYNYISYVVEIKEGGYLVLEYDDYDSYTKNNRILRFNEEKVEMWRYDYNTNGSKKESQYLQLLDKDSSYFYGLLREKSKKEEKYYLVVVNMQTGKEVHKKQIQDPENALPRIFDFPTISYGELYNKQRFEDKIVIVGRTASNTLNYKNALFSGLSRLMIDKKTFDARVSLLTYKECKKFLPSLNGMGMMGSIGSMFILDPRDIFFFPDGRVGILFEKYKPASQYTPSLTTDLVLIYTDQNFKPAGAKVFDKARTKQQHTDYLFSQNINGGKDIVFFYRDYQKDDENRHKHWNLFINTFIDGKLNQEMIPISSKKDFFIIPYIAKEGYILLREYNKKAKYNQIRLERLNY